MKLRKLFLPVMFILPFFSQSSFAQTAEFFYNSGIDCASRQDYNGAITNFTKAIELIQTDAKLYNYRGICRFNLRDFTNAMTDFNQAIQLNPNFADAYYMRGMCRIGLKDRKGACLDFQKASDLNHANARDALDKYCS
ncbi:MAG: tetratricopeptide repeat protein [Bacteroidota bacterium]